jgi:hypothetical protein
MGKVNNIFSEIGGIHVAKDEKLNEEAALNNNLGSSTLKMNQNKSKLHTKPKTKSKK